MSSLNWWYNEEKTLGIDLDEISSWEYCQNYDILKITIDARVVELKDKDAKDLFKILKNKKMLL